MTALYEYGFTYFSDIDGFMSANGQLLRSLKGSRLIRAYSAWDFGDSSWFLDAPSILEFDTGTLAVCIMSGIKTGMLWNTIPLDMKPSWTDFQDPDLDFDLTWKDTGTVNGMTIESISLVSSGHTLTGIIFSGSGSRFAVVDNGDETLCLPDGMIDPWLEDSARFGEITVPVI